ncbi:mucin-5AC [Anopheles nili]|uniref:mucin-5AC n=1 Tax=Anopheles nili TaxID=185578 RepID=UPI00237A5E3A|nr:mucin-5AC [Anopheles nili]
MEPGPGSSSAVPNAGGGGAGGGGGGGGPSGPVGGGVVTRPPITALFREIHKNSWLRRLNNDSRRPSVLTKKPDRYWVVFCVHDDCEAFLEGYSDPRQAPSHAPEWALALQTVQHVSHALVSVEQEFEFVITLDSEVARFNAHTWECMQEWVDCLRSKLREMKLLSPKENLYSRLPEVRPPLAPTRDPTSPLPATPPVPAALVPGIERVQPPSLLLQQQHHNHHHHHHLGHHSGPSGSGMSSSPANGTAAFQTMVSHTGTTSSTSSSASSSSSSSSSSASSYSSTLTSISNCPNGDSRGTPAVPAAPPAMSNTSTQNLMNLLSNPLQAVSSINSQTIASCESSSIAGSSSSSITDEDTPEELPKRTAPTSPPTGVPARDGTPSSLPKPQKIVTRELSATGSTVSATITPSLATTFVNNVLADPSGTAGGPSLKRTVIDKLLLDVRPAPERSVENVDTTIVEADHTPDALTTRHDGGTTGGNESRPRQPHFQQQHATEVSCQNGTISNGTATSSTSNGTPTAAPAASYTPMVLKSGGAICIEPPASGGTRVEPKRTRRKISPLAKASFSPTSSSEEPTANITIIQVSNSSIAGTPSPTITTASSPKPASRFNFPKATPSITIPSAGTTAVATIVTDDDPFDGSGRWNGDHSYKSNVQIIPSNVEYSANEDHLMQPSIIASINEQQITTVTVPNVHSVPVTKPVIAAPRLQPTAAATVQVAVATSSTPIKGPETNFGTVTQIAVNSSVPAAVISDGKPTQSVPQQYYEQVFLSSSVQVTPGNERSESDRSFTEQAPVAVAPIVSKATGNKSSKVLLLSRQSRSSSHSDIPLPGRTAAKGNRATEGGSSSDKENRVQPDAIHAGDGATDGTASTSKQVAPAAPMHLTGGSPSKRPAVDKNIYTPHPQRTGPQLQRGLTELVLSTRPAVASSTGSALEHPTASGRGRRPPVENKIRNDQLPAEQRRRSSSTSETRQERSSRMNAPSAGNGTSGNNGGRLQSPPQPFRPHHALINVSEGGGQLNGPGIQPGGAGGNRKLTLREQQVFQLRREMMHPGGVRLQLRRKDCINSIGLVDAFGAVWVAGWKQKEHPVLYNALHIGDQMISVAGVAITSAADAHKAIRAAPGLFVELIIRRVPFGRVYAIRREIDGQCLGLIRDGNTATIVDVVPNSLAARHGLPPKAKSCDGLSLTFWVLTEINGRPLNLFFKENEIRDRLNAVGRDISILVQPADLVTKLKKQLKSLRGHKDFIVQ